MDDGMKRVSRERLEPALKLHKNMNYNMIRCPFTFITMYSFISESFINSIPCEETGFNKLGTNSPS